MIALILVMGAAVAAFVVLQTTRGLIPHGPSWAVGDGQYLWLLSHGSLHVLDARGTRVTHVRLEELGLSDSASDLRPLSVDEVIVHDADRVLRCVLPAKRCRPLARGLDLATRGKDGRKLDFDPARGLLALSDVSQHHLYLFDVADGTARLTAENREDFRYPNQPRWIDGELWLADTNHHRLIKMAEPAPVWKIAATLDTQSWHLRPGRHFPFAFLRLPSGEFWVLVANYRMAMADLLVIGADGKPTRRIALGDDQDPVSLVAAADKIIVPDLTAFSLTALDQQGNVLGPFGDDAFRAEMAAAKERAQWGHRAPLLLAVLLGVCLVAGLVLSIRSGALGAVRGNPWRPVEAQTSQLAVAPASQPSADLPIVEGDATLVELLPAVRRRLTVMLVVSLALAAVVFGTVLMLSYADLIAIARIPDLTPNTRHMVWAVGLAMAGVLAAAIYAAHSVMRWRGLALTWENEMPRVRVGGHWHCAPVEHVMVTPVGLYLGGQRVPLRIGRMQLFDEAALRRLILDRLPDSCFAGHELKAFAHLWRFGGFWWRASMVAVIVSVIAEMVTRVLLY